MNEDWQFCFRVKGLIVPPEGILFKDNILFCGVEDRTEETNVFIKMAVEVNDRNNVYEENYKRAEKARDAINEILKIYAVVTGEHAEVSDGWSASRIQPDNPFGNPKHVIGGKARFIVSEKEIKCYAEAFNKALKDYELLQTVFSDEKKAFLLNAVEYLYHATGDRRLEAKLIDLMISLESLFGEEQEIRLRISLRAAYLLSLGRESERAEIFRVIYKLYNKRSKIVHGGEKVRLEHEEVYDLENLVRESIVRLIPLKLSREEVVTLLDESVYDENKKREIDGLISSVRTN